VLDWNWTPRERKVRAKLNLRNLAQISRSEHWGYDKAQEIIMQSRSVIVSDTDIERLNHLVRHLRHSRFRDQAQRELLGQTLENAEVTSSARFPRNAIKMNSRFRVLDLGTGKKQVYTLVYPDQAEASSGSISVLAPLGIALLGRKQGDTIDVDVPGRIRQLRIERVLYPPDRFRKRLRAQAGTIVAMSSTRDLDSLTLAA
jgi:regulator of nucleoside diphosphate kinase